MNRKPVWTIGVGALMGVLVATIYFHIKSPATFIDSSIASNSKSLVGNIDCTIDRSGRGVATGYVNASVNPESKHPFAGVVKITATFYDGRAKEESASSYFDSTDPKYGSDQANVFYFSIVGDNGYGGSPTSLSRCVISATESYGSSLASG